MYLNKEQNVNRFDKNNEPVLRCSLPASITFETNDSFAGQVQSEDDSMDSFDYDIINPCTGPVYFEGVKPGDVLEIDLSKYAEAFDIVFMEGGILHYFHDINVFMKMMHAILKPGGKMICSDFHPFTKILDSLNLERPTMSYFSTEIYEGEMAHARFYEEEIRRKIPKCMYRRYTVSEIINAILENGFVLKRFDEHPAWENQNLPGEFTAVAIRQAE